MSSGLKVIEARDFAASVAGVLDRAPEDLPAALDDLGWLALATDPELVVYAGLGGVELGRRLAPVREVDRLLGAELIAGDLVRSPGAAIIASEPVPSLDGLELHRVIELGDIVAADQTALGAWTAASTGYLAGLGQAALELTVAYVRERRAFGTTLSALAPVQQRLADAATAVRGVTLLAADRPDADALLHAGPAIVEACEGCHQVSGAIGFTREYPLHRYTLLARALAVWNDAWLRPR